MTDNPVSDELLVAYVDGTVDEARKAALAAREATDRDFHARAAAYRRLRRRLNMAFDPILEEPVPQRLLNAAMAPPRRGDVLPLRPRVARAVRVSAALKGAMAMAASLLVGILIGRHILDGHAPPSAFMADRGGLYADGPLAARLQTSPSGEADGESAFILLSFRDAQGGFCRVFRLESARLAGLACLEGRHWRLAALEAVDAALAAPGLRPAGAALLPPAIRDGVARRIDGDPLSLEEERAALAAGWRP